MKMENNKNRLLLLFICLVVLIVGFCFYIINSKKNECEKIPEKQEKFLGTTNDGCSINEISIKKYNNYPSVMICYVDTLKYVSCPQINIIGQVMINK